MMFRPKPSLANLFFPGERHLYGLEPTTTKKIQERKKKERCHGWQTAYAWLTRHPDDLPLLSPPLFFSAPSQTQEEAANRRFKSKTP